jgi:hypothetical protein
VVVDGLDIGRTSFGPREANPPLVVDPDATLSLPIAGKSLEPVFFGTAKIA